MAEFASKTGPKSKSEIRPAGEKRAPEPGGEPLGDRVLRPADRAFTYGRDLFLAATVPRVQRKAEGEVVSDAEEREADAAAAKATDTEAPAGLIVDDGQALGPGQMARGAFLAELRAATTATAAESLGPMWASGGCPYLEAWFARHEGDDAATLERMARRYAGEAATAADYISAVCTRLREGIAAWSSGAALGGHLDAAGLGGEAEPGAPGVMMAKEAPGAGSGTAGKGGGK